MKKLLALVMALVMTLGLATVAANAAYPDAADVELKEAVEVMSAVGVFQGDENGNFKPQANLDRAAAAKLIAYLDLGEKTAEALPAVKAFGDVPATHWAAKYIAYCANAGYVAGAGDGNYYPSNPLTGYAFGKMVLCVLGYDAGIESFTGAAWAINVAKLMESNGINDGIDAAASANLTREQAAQYCLNALKADMVEYSDKGTSIEINGAKITSGAKAAAPKTATADAKYSAIDSKMDGTKDIVQLGEKLYNGDLTLTKSTEDEVGRPAHTWDYKDDEVGVYGDTAKLVYTAEVSTGDMYKALKSYYIESAVDCDENSASQSTGTLFSAQTKAAVAQGQSDSVAALTGNGKTVEIYADGDKILTKIVVIAPVLGEVTNVSNTSANSKHGAYTTYTFDGKSGKVYSSVVDKDADKDTAVLNGTFKKNDYCTYYKTDDGYVLDPVTSVSGVLSSITSKNVMTIDGTSYKLSAISGAVKPAVSKSSQDFYVDSFGYVVKAYTDTNDKYAYVVSSASKNVLADDGSLESKDFAVLVFADGTVKEVRTKSLPTPKAVYTYTVNDKDVYTLTALTDRHAEAISLGDDAKSVGALYTNAKTVYYVLKYAKDDEDVMKFQKTVTAYTGYTNAPAFTAESGNPNIIFALDSSSSKDDIADVVFIDTLKDAADTGKYVYVKGGYEETSSGYDYETIVAGEDSTTNRETADLTADTLYTELSTPTAATAVGTTIQNKGGLLFLDGSNSGKTIADDVPVYTINMDDDTATIGTAADLSSKFEADPNSIGGTRGVYVEYNSDSTKAQTVYIIYNSED